MEFGSNFVVPAPTAIVFEKLLDPVVMKACIPGCEELERLSDEQYRGRMRSEIAHVRFDAAFSANVVDVTAPTHVHALLQGEDKRIASSLRIDANLDLEDKGEVTAVSYTLDLALWGRVGRLGEAIVRRRSLEVQQQFEEAFVAACRGAGAEQSGALSEQVAETPAAPVAVVGQAESRRRWWRVLFGRLFGRR